MSSFLRQYLFAILLPREARGAGCRCNPSRNHLHIIPPMFLKTPEVLLHLQL